MFAGALEMLTSIARVTKERFKKFVNFTTSGAGVLVLGGWVYQNCKFLILGAGPKKS